MNPLDTSQNPQTPIDPASSHPINMQRRKGVEKNRPIDTQPSRSLTNPIVVHSIKPELPSLSSSAPENRTIHGNFSKRFLILRDNENYYSNFGTGLSEAESKWHSNHSIKDDQDPEYDDIDGTIQEPIRIDPLKKLYYTFGKISRAIHSSKSFAELDKLESELIELKENIEKKGQTENELERTLLTSISCLRLTMMFKQWVEPNQLIEPFDDKWPNKNQISDAVKKMMPLPGVSFLQFANPEIGHQFYRAMDKLSKSRMTNVLPKNIVKLQAGLKQLHSLLLDNQEQEPCSDLQSKLDITRETYLSIWNELVERRGELNSKKNLFYSEFLVSVAAWSMIAKTEQEEADDRILLNNVFGSLVEPFMKLGSGYALFEELFSQILKLSNEKNCFQIESKLLILLELFFRYEVPLSPNHIALAYELNMVKLIEVCIDKGVLLCDVLNDQNQRSQIHLACKKNQLSLIIKLIEKGAYTQQQDSLGNTALHYAAEQGNEEMIQALVLQAHQTPTSMFRNKEGLTPFHVACKRGHLTAVIRLYDLIDKQCEEYKIFLYDGILLGCQYGHLNVVRCLLKKCYPKDKKGRLFTWFSLACENGNPLIIEELRELSKEIGPSDRRKTIHEGFFRAVQLGHSEVVRNFIETGLVKESSSLYRALVISLKEGRDLIAQDLIDRKEIKIGRKDAKGCHLFLHLACKHRASEGTILAILRKIALSWKDIYDMCCHHMGYLITRLENCSLPPKENINNLTGLFGSVLHAASYGNEKELINYLSDKLGTTAIQWNLRNEQSFTPVQIAARYGRVEVLEYLLGKVGLEEKLQNRNTVLGLASAQNHLAMVKFIYEKLGQQQALEQSQQAFQCALQAKSYSTALFLFAKNRSLKIDPNQSWDFLCYLCSEKEEDQSEVSSVLNNLLPLDPTVFTKSDPQACSTLFHLASEAGNFTALQSLIDIAENQTRLTTLQIQQCLSQPRADGNNPFHLAAMAQSLPCLLLLEKHGVVDIFLPNREGKTVLDLDQGFLLRALIRRWIGEKKLDLFKIKNQRYRYLLACQEGNEELGLSLVDKASKEDFDRLFYDRKSYLHIACQYKLDRLAEVLLDRGVSIFSRDSSGRFALHWACENALEKVALRMIKRMKKEELHKADAEGRTPLHLACWSANESIAKALVEKSNQVDLDKQDKRGRSALHEALDAKTPSIASFLLIKGADPDNPDIRNFSPIILAVENGLTEIAEELERRIGHPMVAKRKTRAGQMLFLLACEKGMYKLLRKLLQRDNLALPINLDKILRTEFYHFLIKNFPDEAVEDATPLKVLSFSLLHQSLLNEKIDISIEYINRNLYIEKQDHRGRLPLHIVCEKGYNEVFKMLPGRRQKDETDKREATPLHYALRGRCKNIISQLLQYEVSLFEKDDTNITGAELFKSLELFDREVVEFKNFFIKDPLKLQKYVKMFCKSGNLAMLQFLITHHFLEMGERNFLFKAIGEREYFLKLVSSMVSKEKLSDYLFGIGLHKATMEPYILSAEKNGHLEVKEFLEALRDSVAVEQLCDWVGC